MDVKGNVWWVGGMRNTGKSHEAKKIAEYFRTRKEKPRRTIIYEHTRNDDTYPDAREIDIDDLDYLLPARCQVRVIHPDWSIFFEKCLKIKNACILVDDATHLFSGNLPEIVGNFTGVVKNNRLEIIFQMHTITETAPKLLRACNMFVIKQTTDEFPLKKDTPSRKAFTKILIDLKNENRNYDGNQKWATWIFDRYEEEIWKKDVTEQDYLKSYKKRISISDYLELN